MESRRQFLPSPSIATFYRRYRVPVLTLIFAAFAVWLLSTWNLVFQRVIHYYSPFPAWDYWRVPYDAYFSRNLGFQIFFRPHNEHRIVFPEIIFQLDVLLLRGRLIFPIVFSVFCYVATWIALCTVLLRDRTVPRTTGLVGAILAGIILGWKGSAVVLADPILLQWTLSNLCVVISIIAMTRVRSLAIVIIAAIVATYSSSNCLLLWPVLILEARLLRMTRRRTAIIVAVAIVAIGLYFIGYHPGSKLNVTVLFSHPLHALGFVASYMSMPFALSRPDSFAICLGATNILITVVLFIYALRRQMLQSPTAVVLFSIYLFILLTAALTTAGRITLSPGYGDAKASRFWAVHLLNWAVFAATFVYLTGKTKLADPKKVIVYAVIILLTAFGTFKLRSSLLIEDDQFANRQLAALAFTNGILDAGVSRRIFPDPAFVFELVPYLRDHHLSIYSLPAVSLLGKPESAAGKRIDQPRSGAVTSTMPVEGGIEVIGWADPERNGSEKIVLLNERGQIAGLGERPSAGFPFDLRSLATPNSEAWVGFVNEQYGGHVVSPFFLTHGRLQPIYSNFPAQTGLTRVRQDGGTLIANIEWQADPAWKVGAIPIQALGNVARGKIYGTWTRDAHEHGKIISSIFSSPESACLLMPVLHGAYVQGLSVEIVNADSGEPIRSIPMQNGDLGWQFWTLSVDKSIARVRIIASDEASGRNQWLAIAQPSTCNNNIH